MQQELAGEQGAVELTLKELALGCRPVAVARDHPRDGDRCAGLSRRRVAPEEAERLARLYGAPER